MRILTPIVVALVAITSAVADTVTLSSARDNTLYEDPAGALSNGGGSYFFAGRALNGALKRGIIAFDFSSIPAGSTITGVQLRLNMSRALSGPIDVTMHRVTSSWTEGTDDAFGQEGGGTTATAGAATWIHRTYPGVLWASPGGDFIATPSAVTSVDFETSYTWGSTSGLVADVQGWLNTPSSNHGWILLGDESLQPSTKRFDARENVAPRRPSLTVTFTTPCPGDLDGDRTIGPADLGVLLAAWLSGPGGDLDGDQQTDSSDLGILLGFWQTSCP